MMMIVNIIFIMFIIGNFIFISKRKHLLIMLMSLEFIILSIYFLMMMYLMMYNNNNMYLLMVFLVFTVCEGALGLSILVSMVRTHGNDYFQSFNLI